MEANEDFQLEGLIDRLKQYIGANPRNAGAHYNLAMAFLRKDLIEEAEFALKMAIDLDGNMVEAFINLGGLYLRQEKLDLAVRANETAIKINPRAALAHNNLGFARLLQNRPTEAIQSFRQALDLLPNLVPARLHLARALEQNDDFQAAITEYLALLKQNPGFGLAHYNLALIYLGRGDIDQARHHYQEARSLKYPVDPEVGRQIEFAE